ncbi:MAG TPA: hypothetical protein VFI42_05470 [Thermomicrobiaceae bacterium]|nr:hypothetical protein [Thermomicrobiaceae bacterium]
MRRFRFAAVGLLAATAFVGTISAASANDAAGCVADFYQVARVQYGWTPEDVVHYINNDDDPTFQVANAGDLTQGVLHGQIGILDEQGSYQFCPAR